MFRFHCIRQFLSNWLDELANFMDPGTGNLFEPVNELAVSDMGDIENSDNLQKHVGTENKLRI